MSVVIIGAGPAGLAAAAGLARRKISYTLLERGADAAAAARTIDPDMALFSPTRLSRLRGMTLTPAGDKPTFRELVAALDRFRDEHGIAVATGHAVTGVERAPGGFVVRTAAGATFEGSHVISATGIAGSPRFPDDVDRDALHIPALHSLAVRRGHVAASRRLLVIGAGASAAEVLSHWRAVRRPDDRAWIAARSGVRGMPSSLLGIDLHYWVWPIEHLPGRPFGPALSPKDAMWGKEIPRAIQRGEIIACQVARYQATSVVLADGTTIEPDLVVFATGFRHDTSHLGELIERDDHGWPIARRCESRRTPGVYVLGSRYARNLASPYLRGIARDAEVVAERIAR
jgi:putative flavoprotein involved in K+ transport